MGETKPPTPGEIAEARDWLDEDTIYELVTDGYDITASAIGVLLAALDAAEARATAAETDLDRLCNVALCCNATTPTGHAPADHDRPVGFLPREAMDAIVKVWRERAEARAALKPFSEYAKTRDASPMLGLGDVIHAIHVKSGRAEITLTDCRAAAAALAKEAPRG